MQHIASFAFSQSIPNLFQFPSPLPGGISAYGTFSWTFHGALEQTNHCIMKSVAKGKAPICRHAASLWDQLNWFELHFSAQPKLPSTVKLFNPAGVLSSLPSAPDTRTAQQLVQTSLEPASSEGRAHPAGFLRRRQCCRNCSALQAQLQEAPSASGKLWGKPQMEKLSGSRILILNSLTLQMSREQQGSVTAREQPWPPPAACTVLKPWPSFKQTQGDELKRKGRWQQHLGNRM